MKESVDAVVIANSGDSMTVLLIERKFQPYRGLFAFPGGDAEEGETSEESALRVLRMEAGLDLSSAQIIPLSIREKSGRDPRGYSRSFPFLFYLDSEQEVTEGDDANKALWKRIVDIEGLSFDHGAILCEALSKFYNFMPSGVANLPQIDLPTIFSKRFFMKELEELTFFPGSFNPFHDGHLACVELCPSENLVVAPDFSPWKQQEHKISSCFFKSFLEIAKKLSGFPCAVYPGFWGLEFTNPTIDWIKIVNNPSLLIGDDSFVGIEKWKEAEQLLGLLKKLYVVPRDHKLTELNSYKIELQKNYPKLEIEILSEHDHMQVSSKEIRSKLNCDS